jgi:predicted dehydrogenase
MTTNTGELADTLVPLRWGIIGTGGIAARFAADLRLLDGAKLVAVGSRSQSGADSFGDRWGVARRHHSYADLVADPEVEAVYVGTPHPGHHDAAVLALEAGKAVLCEKPFMINASEADHVIGLARERGLFAMEAMWTRFLPHMVRVRELLDSGVLGEIRTVIADHGQCFEPDPAHRLFDPALAGGALLDLGVYPVSFASFVLGTPATVTAVSDPAFTGVDGQTSVLLQYPGGAQAVLSTTLWAAGPNRAAVVGTRARIEIDRTWYAPTTFTVVGRDDEVLERYELPGDGNGLRFQAAEVARCVRGGHIESTVMPLDETRAIAATMDEVRRQIGLVYPGE